MTRIECPGYLQQLRTRRSISDPPTTATCLIALLRFRWTGVAAWLCGAEYVGLQKSRVHGERIRKGLLIRRALQLPIVALQTANAAMFLKCQR